MPPVPPLGKQCATNNSSTGSSGMQHEQSLLFTQVNRQHARLAFSHVHRTQPLCQACSPSAQQGEACLLDGGYSHHSLHTSFELSASQPVTFELLTRALAQHAAAHQRPRGATRCTSSQRWALLASCPGRRSRQRVRPCQLAFCGMHLNCHGTVIGCKLGSPSPASPPQVHLRRHWVRTYRTY